jgi:hypothetical protein
MKKSELVCKHCGNTEEFYTKERYKGTCYAYFRTDGQEAENGDLYTNFIYCAECDSRVCKVEELEE